MKLFRPRQSESAEIGSIKRDLDDSVSRLNTATRRLSQVVESNSRERQAKQLQAFVKRARHAGAAE